MKRPSPASVLGSVGPAAAWTPLAVAAAVWLLLLLFGGGLVAGETGPAARLLVPLTQITPVGAALVLSAIGLLAGSALPPLLSGVYRLAAAGSVLLFWAAVLLAYQLLFDLPGTPAVVGAGVTGMLVGFLLGGIAGPGLQRSLAGPGRRQPPLLGILAAGCALLSALPLLAPAQPLTAPFASFAPAELVTGVPERVYALIKVAMLWVPLGFLGAAAGRPRLLRVWTVAGVAGFLLVFWPFAGSLQVADLLEVLGAPVGVWVGLWIGARTRGGEPAPEPAHALREEARTAPAAAAPTGPAMAGGAVFQAAGTGMRQWPATPVGDDALPRVPGEVARAGPVAPPASGQGSTGAAPSAPEIARLGPFTLPRPSLLLLPPALALLALAAWGWWGFPRYQLALGVALLLYVLLLGVARHAWMVAIPALLPVLDLAPWTGRFFLDETDLFLLATLGAAALHRPDPRAGPYLARPIAVLAGLFAATTLIAALVGLLPLSPLDANAFATYFSHYNALRVAKGFAWGFAVFLLLRWTVPKGSPVPARLLTLGLLIGLAGVILIGLRERWQFAALLDFSEPYRITASFSSMHTGGSHLPAFLALVVPFVWLWVARLREGARTPLLLAAGVAFGLTLFAGVLYLTVSTVTRAAVLALAVELALLALFWLRGPRASGVRRLASTLLLAAMAVIAGAILYLGTQGSYFQHRASMVMEDADTRLSHWRQAVAMMDEGLPTRLFGMGLGSFPETYLQRNPAGAVPGNFSYADEGGNGFLLLGSGETLYLAQRVPVRPGREYRLSFDLRGRGNQVRLTMPICEKHLLDSRDCIWKTHGVPGSGGWEHKEVSIPSGGIGRGGWLDRPPVELFLYNGERDSLVAVDNLSLRDEEGRELLRNGDFSAGGDFWFFKTHDHLAWHIKNLWVSLLFEQGWAGLIVFNLLLLGVLLHLFGPAWRGNATAAAVLTSLVGFLTVGLFASPFDAPRLSALFLTILATGLHAVPAIEVVRRTRRPRLRRHRKPGHGHRSAAASPGSA